MARFTTFELASDFSTQGQRISDVLGPPDSGLFRAAFNYAAATNLTRVVSHGLSDLTTEDRTYTIEELKEFGLTSKEPLTFEQANFRLRAQELEKAFTIASFNSSSSNVTKTLTSIGGALSAAFMDPLSLLVSLGAAQMVHKTLKATNLIGVLDKTTTLGTVGTRLATFGAAEAAVNVGIGGAISKTLDRPYESFEMFADAAFGLVLGAAFPPVSFTKKTNRVQETALVHKEMNTPGTEFRAVLTPDKVYEPMGTLPPARKALPPAKGFLRIVKDEPPPSLKQIEDLNRPVIGLLPNLKSIKETKNSLSPANSNIIRFAETAVTFKEAGSSVLDEVKNLKFIRIVKPKKVGDIASDVYYTPSNPLGDRGEIYLHSYNRLEYRSSDTLHADYQIVDDVLTFTINHLYIDHANRGKGIASKLIETLASEGGELLKLRRFKDLNATRLKINSSLTKLETTKFLEKKYSIDSFFTKPKFFPKRLRELNELYNYIARADFMQTFKLESLPYNYQPKDLVNTLYRNINSLVEKNPKLMTDFIDRYIPEFATYRIFTDDLATIVKHADDSTFYKFARTFLGLSDKLLRLDKKTFSPEFFYYKRNLQSLYLADLRTFFTWASIENGSELYSYTVAMTMFNTDYAKIFNSLISEIHFNRLYTMEEVSNLLNKILTRYRDSRQNKKIIDATKLLDNYHTFIRDLIKGKD